MLASLSCFEYIDRDVLDAIESRARRMTYAAGTSICREGEIGESMFVILSGDVRVKKTIDCTSKDIATLTSGDFFGEMIMITAAERTASVIALTVVEAYEITRELFYNVFSQHPNLLVRVSDAIIKRTHENERHEVAALQARTPAL